MKHGLQRLLTEQKGSVSIIVTAMVTLMISIGALVTDLGSLYVQAAKAQTAADAAMLAAGSYLPIEASDLQKQQEIQKIAADYLEKNGANHSDGYTIYLKANDAGQYNTLGVAVRGTVPTGFAKLFGVDTLSFEKEAEVQTTVCVRLKDVVPLSVQKGMLDTALATGNTTHIYLKYGGGGGTNGAFGAIDLDGVQGGGANDFERWLMNGFEGELSVSSQLYPVESGNMAGSTQRAFSSRYNQCTHFQGNGGCTYEHYHSFCPRVIKVPVVEYDSKKKVHIVGFAAFVLESQGNADEIKGSYVDMVTVGSAGADQTGQATDYGVYSLMMSK